jgi:hypothetical protein
VKPLDRWPSIESAHRTVVAHHPIRPHSPDAETVPLIGTGRVETAALNVIIVPTGAGESAEVATTTLMPCAAKPHKRVTAIANNLPFEVNIVFSPRTVKRGNREFTASEAKVLPI